MTDTPIETLPVRALTYLVGFDVTGLAGVSSAAMTTAYAPSTQYVETWGSDSNGGFFPWQPKLTVAAAVAALPSTGSGTTAHHYGTIYIGRGTFTESAGLEWRADIQYIGISQGSLGTVIKLADNQNAPLFDHGGTFAGFAHNTLMQNLTVDGNLANNATGTGVRMRDGGFSCNFNNVFFKNCATWIDVVRTSLTIQFNNCDWSGCGTGKLELNGQLGQFVVDGGQCDNCVTDWLEVTQTGNGYGNEVTIQNFKIERQTNSQFDKAIVFNPKSTSGGNPVWFRLLGVSIGGGATIGTALLYEADQLGAACWVHMEDISQMTTGNYTYAFQSVKSGSTTTKSFTTNAVDDYRR